MKGCVCRQTSSYVCYYQKLPVCRQYFTFCLRVWIYIMVLRCCFGCICMLSIYYVIYYICYCIHWCCSACTFHISVNATSKCPLTQTVIENILIVAEKLRFHIAPLTPTLIFVHTVSLYVAAVPSEGRAYISAEARTPR